MNAGCRVGEAKRRGVTGFARIPHGVYHVYRTETGALVPQEKFDIAKIARLDDEGRFGELDPEVMWNALGRPSPDGIVDIGAGTGLFARRFARLAPRSTVYAVDTEPAMLRWIADHEEPGSAGRVRGLLAEETCVPLDDETADLVVMINLHHELEDPLATYREALRILRPAGQLLVADWARTDMKGGPPMEIRATGEELVGVLRRAGFEEIVVHEGSPRHHLITARKHA
jgi:SAM-dependent methyltransferase